MYFTSYPFDKHNCYFELGSCKTSYGLYQMFCSFSVFYDANSMDCSTRLVTPDLFPGYQQRELQYTVKWEPLPSSRTVMRSATSYPKSSKLLECFTSYLVWAV